mgnify:CR=1 FL=1
MSCQEAAWYLLGQPMSESSSKIVVYIYQQFGLINGRKVLKLRNI